MPASLCDLPSKILYTIAELVQSSPSDRRAVNACASSCSILRAIFRPLVWECLEISESHDGDGVRGEVVKRKQCAVERNGEGLERDLRQCGLNLLGSSGAQRVTDDPPFFRALTALDDVLTASPETAAYVKELEVYVPRDCFGVAKFANEGVESGKEGYSGELSERERLFPCIASRLVNVRKLWVSLGSHCSQRRSPPRSRVDWDDLSAGVQSGFATLFRAGKLEEVVSIGVVIPPVMLFGLGAGMLGGGRAVSSQLRKLELVAHCCLTQEELEEMDQPLAKTSFGSLYSLPTTTPPHTLTSLHLGFCDTPFLQYILSVYPVAFMRLKHLSLNIIEVDLNWCQYLLDILAGSPPLTKGDGKFPSFVAPSQATQCKLESFDCTIRCNTPSLHHGLLNVHGLDFSRCSSLKHLALKYFFLTRITRVVKKAMEINVASALSCRVAKVQANERVDAGLQRKGVQTLHLVVDWAFTGDAILLEAFKDLDKIVEDAYYTPGCVSYGQGQKRNLNLERFKVEATHWPCHDTSNCGF